MRRYLAMQCLAACIVTLVTALGWGFPAARSAFLAGLACLVPNAMFAARLAWVRWRAQHDASVQTAAARQVAAFFIGEITKVGATLGLLALIARWVPMLNWPAMVVAIVAVLKAPLLLAFFQR